MEIEIIESEVMADMNTYPENEILAAAKEYEHSEYDAVAFERQRVAKLLAFLQKHELDFDTISCCQCTATQSMYHFTSNNIDLFIWGENSHPLESRTYFFFKLDRQSQEKLAKKNI